MRDTLSGLKTAGSERNDDVFRRNEHGNLPLHRRVVVDLLKRITRETQGDEHALMVRAILKHLLRQAVVHVLLDTLSRLHLVYGLFTDDLGTHGTRSGEGLHDGLGLELDRSLHEEWVRYTTGSRPRLHAFLVLETEQLQTIYISSEPLLTCVDVPVNIAKQISRN